MNIKQHTLQSGERVLLVPVPDSYNHRIIDEDNVLIGTFRDSDAAVKKHYQSLSKGNWQLIGISDEITEEQAKELGFISLESFQSLLQSLGCEGRHAVLKEVK